ncbi:hypothetical protein ACEN4K_10445 [Marinilactibacillus psychrotolerans]|uniref:hypothetical protein n=1 Tax=Marinilactibacillus psychrotolerans TaxID=191770 RepID=UPI0038870CFC
MSDRDKQNKHTRESNISSSMHARVNVGRDLNSNTDNSGLFGHFDVGSMNNLDEKGPSSDSPSFLNTALFYVIGIGLSIAFMLIGLWIFNDYFNSTESNEFWPSAASIVVPLILGFISSKLILIKINKFL